MFLLTNAVIPFSSCPYFASLLSEVQINPESENFVFRRSSWKREDEHIWNHAYLC